MDMPTDVEFTVEELIPYITKDKKFDGEKISLIQVDTVGKAYIKEVDLNWMKRHLEEYKK